MEAFAVAGFGGKDERRFAIQSELDVHGFSHTEFAGEHHADAAFTDGVAASAKLGLRVVAAQHDDAAVEPEALEAARFRADGFSRFGRLRHWGNVGRV